MELASFVLWCVWLWRVVWGLGYTMAVSMQAFVSQIAVMPGRGAVAPVPTWLGGGASWRVCLEPVSSVQCE